MSEILEENHVGSGASVQSKSNVRKMECESNDGSEVQEEEVSKRHVSELVYLISVINIVRILSSERTILFLLCVYIHILSIDKGFYETKSLSYICCAF